MSSEKIEVIGSRFSNRGCDGDFGWMIEQPEYEDALFVFNDNEEQFLEHLRDPTSSFGCAAGGGNAVIRPYQCRHPPRSVGIPTGVNGQGYAELADDVGATIDAAISRIRDLVTTGQYRRIFFSSDGSGGLGTGIFEVGNPVKEYIIAELMELQS